MRSFHSENCADCWKRKVLLCTKIKCYSHIGKHCCSLEQSGANSHRLCSRTCVRVYVLNNIFFLILWMSISMIRCIGIIKFNGICLKIVVLCDTHTQLWFNFIFLLLLVYSCHAFCIFYSLSLSHFILYRVHTYDIIVTGLWIWMEQLLKNIVAKVRNIDNNEQQQQKRKYIQIMDPR